MPIVRFVVYAVAKVLSKVFGLATLAFFGRMPSRNDDAAAAIGLASITWLPVVAAVFIPELAEFIIPFAPDDETVLRILAIVFAIALPLAVGVAVARLHNQRGDHGRPTWRCMVDGFWYTPVIGVVVSALVIVVPILKLGHLLRRYDTQRLLVMIPMGAYDDLVDHIVSSLHRRGIEVEVGDPGRIMRLMFGWLVYVLGHMFARDVPEKLVILRGHDADDEYFEVTVHAADLTIMGHQKVACRVRAVLAEELDERVVYFTWDDASQAIEDRMRELREELESGGEPDLDAVRQLSEDLATVELDAEEWNNVRRNLFRLERDSYARAAGARDPADEDHEVQEQDPEDATAEM